MSRASAEDDIPPSSQNLIDPLIRSPPLSPLENELGPGLSRFQAWSLYTSHFLSTWNIRTYEFAAIIFAAAAYPNTLVAVSVRGIVRALASICFSSTVGRWVDRTPSRLKTLLSTICINRVSVIAASVLWFVILLPESTKSGRTAEHSMSSQTLLKGFIFTVIMVFEILEALSTTGNMLSMERDWIVEAAAPDGEPYDLTNLNAVMRRIDLVCKLVAPLLFSVAVSAMGTRIGVIFVGAMSLCSWAIELWCARRVWRGNSRLRAPKNMTLHAGASPPLSANGGGTNAIMPRVRRIFRVYTQDLKNYFASEVWIPSLALALLHISVLTYGGLFITYLLSIGFSLDLITVARAISSVVEISSTVVTPAGVKYLSKARSFDPERNLQQGRDDMMANTRNEAEVGLLGVPGDTKEEKKVEVGLERLGLWGVNWQLFCLVPVVFALWSLSPSSTPPHSSTPSLPALLVRASAAHPLFSTLLLFTFLSLSRLGLWIFDLTTQQLTQTLTVAAHRSSFTGVEYGFVSLFGLAQSLVTLVFYRPEQFIYIAVGSCAAVAVSAASYAAWVRGRRGHLLHLSS